MKSKRPPKGGGSNHRDPEKDLNEQQLAKIGAICLQFNYAEDALDRCLMYSLDLKFHWLDIVRRFRDVPQKVELYRISVSYADRILTEGCKRPDLAFKDLAKGVVDDLVNCKEYRDNIVHSQIYNTTPTIGQKYGYRGEDGVVYTLMSQDALQGMYDRLTYARQGLEMLERFISLIRPMVIERHVTGRSTLSPAQEAQECLMRLHSLHQERQSLKPLPKFPD